MLLIVSENKFLIQTTYTLNNSDTGLSETWEPSDCPIKT
jgi:hypothetical protein